MTDTTSKLKRLEFLTHHLENGTLEGEEGKELAALIRQGRRPSTPTIAALLELVNAAQALDETLTEFDNGKRMFYSNSHAKIHEIISKLPANAEQIAREWEDRQREIGAEAAFLLVHTAEASKISLDDPQRGLGAVDFLKERAAYASKAEAAVIVQQLRKEGE